MLAHKAVMNALVRQHTRVHALHVGQTVRCSHSQESDAPRAIAVDMMKHAIAHFFAAFEGDFQTSAKAARLTICKLKKHAVLPECRIARRRGARK